jgi:hypothetical protein
LPFRQLSAEMPAPICNLRVTRPTSTTISFTVSTRRPLETVTARVLHYLSICIRVLIASAVLLILWMKWDLLYPSAEEPGVPTWIASSLPGAAAILIAHKVMARYLVPLSGLALWACARRGYTGTLLVFLLRCLIVFGSTQNICLLRFQFSPPWMLALIQCSLSIHFDL